MKLHVYVYSILFLSRFLSLLCKKPTPSRYTSAMVFASYVRLRNNIGINTFEIVVVVGVVVVFPVRVVPTSISLP